MQWLFILYAIGHLVACGGLLYLTALTAMPWYSFWGGHREHAQGLPSDTWSLTHYRYASDSEDAMRLNTHVLQRSTAIHLILAAGTYGLLTRIIDSPYGRHARQLPVHWSLPAGLSWALQESPTILNVAFFVFVEYPMAAAGAPSTAAPAAPYGQLVKAALSRLHIGMLLFVLHYVHRSLIYPTRLPARANRVPIAVTWSATLYCLLNGRLQVLANVAAVTAFRRGQRADVQVSSSAAFVRCWFDMPSPEDTQNWWWSLLVVAALTAGVLLGSALFFVGMSINMRSDYYLVALRRSTATHQIPRGGWFEWVSCPNFLGEILEWLGYALVVAATTYVSTRADCTGFTHGLSAQGWAALGFFVYVLSNLLPRAASHHRWYVARFGRPYADLQRKAVLPGLY